MAKPSFDHNSSSHEGCDDESCHGEGRDNQGRHHAGPRDRGDHDEGSHLEGTPRGDMKTRAPSRYRPECVRTGLLIAAAGRGTRSGLDYPKTLFEVQGQPILARILRGFSDFAATSTTIVSPSGLTPISECLARNALESHLVVQPEPRGMGHAVLRFEASPSFSQSEHVLLVWGDIPFLQRETVQGLIDAHFDHGNDFTLATRVVERPYTVVVRGDHRADSNSNSNADADSGDGRGRVERVFETREEGGEPPRHGERDIGLFIFRRDVVFPLLKEDRPRKFGRSTGEHGFLYVIEHVARSGYRVEAIPNAQEKDLVSFNALADLNGYR